jgi:hypothetical protein
MNTSDKSNSEDDLEMLWNKWTYYPVSDLANELCYEAVKPLNSLLHDLIMQCLDANIYPRKKALELGEWSGDALGRLSRGSFMLGLEYPNLNKDSTVVTNDKLYRLLEQVGEGATRLITLFLSELVKQEQFSLLQAEKIAEMGGKYIRKGVIDCYYIGVRFSPKLRDYS